MADMTFPKGVAFAEWLIAASASSKLGEIIFNHDNTDPPSLDVGKVGPMATRWLYSVGEPTTTHYFSFNTPIAAAPKDQCGKVGFAGIHVSRARLSAGFPGGCGTKFTES